MKISDKKKRIRYNKARMSRVANAWRKLIWRPKVVKVCFDIEVDKRQLAVQPRYKHIFTPPPLSFIFDTTRDEYNRAKVSVGNLPQVTSVPNSPTMGDWVDWYC